MRVSANGFKMAAGYGFERAAKKSEEQNKPERADQANPANSADCAGQANWANPVNPAGEIDPDAPDSIIELRKKDPALDRAMYLADLAKMHDDISKAEQIAKKVAKGEPISDEEKEFILKNDPEKYKRAIEARKRACYCQQGVL